MRSMILDLCLQGYELKFEIHPFDPNRITISLKIHGATQKCHILKDKFNEWDICHAVKSCKDSLDKWLTLQQGR